MTTLHPVIARSLAAWAPPASEVHQAAEERRREERRIAYQQRYLAATKQATDFPRDFNTVEARL